MPRPRKRWSPLLASYPYSVKVNRCSIGAEMLYARLIAQSDDNGNYWAAPGQVTAQLLVDRMIREELSPAEVSIWLDELEANKLIKRYELDGKNLLHIENSFSVKRADTKEDVRFPIPDSQAEAKAAKKAKETALKETIKLVDEVIDHLNEKTGSRFQHSDASRDFAVARIHTDGFLQSDLMLVVDHKISEWDTPKMAQYLRPKTLFGPNQFVAYLTAAKLWNKQGRKMKLGNYIGKHSNTDYSEAVQ